MKKVASTSLHTSSLVTCESTDSGPGVILDISEFDPEATDVRLLFDAVLEEEPPTGAYITVVVGDEVVVIKSHGNAQRTSI